MNASTIIVKLNNAHFMHLEMTVLDPTKAV